MAKTCGFCGGPGATKEHLWPDWLRKSISRGGKGKKFDAEFERDGKIKKFQTLVDRERCLALSRWFVKVAMVFEFTGDKKYFSEDERRQCKELFAMPENTWIWAGRYDGPRPVHGVERRAWSQGS